MGLGGLLAPLWWLWYAILYLYSHSWALAACVAVTSTVYLAYRHLLPAARQQAVSRQKLVRPVTDQVKLGREVRQVLPVHPYNGWSLDTVSHRLRLFSRFFPALSLSNSPCLGATTIIPVSPKKLLSIATNGRDIPCWLEGVTMAPQYIRRSRGSLLSDGDIIQLSFRTSISEEGVVRRSWGQMKRWGTNFTQKYATFLDGIFSVPTQFNSETFEREWSFGEDGCGQICWVARQPSKLPYCWSLLVFSASVKEKNQSVSTLVMLPKSPEDRPLTSNLLTSQLAALKDFSSLRRSRVYSITSTPGRVMAENDEVTLPAQLPPPLRNSSAHSSSGGHGDIFHDLASSQVPSLSAGDPAIIVPNGPLSGSLPPPGATGHPTHSVPSQREQLLHSQPSLGFDSTPTESQVGDSATPTRPRPPESGFERLGRESCDRLVQVAEATEQDGWVAVGMKNNVFVMKKPSEKGGSSVNCVKGTAIVKAPPEFVYRILRDRDNTPTLDEMLKESRIVDQISDTVCLVHLLYKAVWPTSARDFTLIVTSGRYDDSTLVDSGVSVVDPRLPEEKGYVRGNVVCGGYVVRAVPDQPEMSEATYVSQVEMKGNIPVFAVNKVTESQPMCVARLRTLAEETYAALKNNAQKMKEFEEKVGVVRLCPQLTPPISQPLISTSEEERVISLSNLVSEMTGDPTQPLADQVGGDNNVNSSAIVSTPPPVAMEIEGQRGDGMLVMEGLRTYTPDEITSEEEEESVQGDDQRQSRAQPSQLPDEEDEEDKEVEMEGRAEEIRFEKKLQPYPFSPSHKSIPSDTESLTEESISFPRQESGGVDFRTLGNQTAARVLEELFHVSSLDIENLSLFDSEGSGWKVIDVEKDIVILRKKSPGSPFYSFMGRGEIELPPRKVYNSIRNPQLRFTYDNMLKELHFVKNIEDGLYVLHIHHETTQCFIKQSRDFCVLVNEREEGSKLLLVGLSIDIPECPVNPNVTRGKIAYSGWVVEPQKIHGKNCARITYLLQVDLGGIPAALVNHVSKRQPLAIAYLRDYLMSTSTLS